jgi:hypothetical protein
MALKIIVEWTDPSGIARELTDVVRVGTRKATEMSHNTMDIVLKNDRWSDRPYISAGGEIQFRPEQQIDVFVRFDDDGAGLTKDLSYLLFAGRVVEFKCVTSEKDSPITLKCSDATYIAMNKLYVGDEIDTIPNLISRVIALVNHGLPARKKITAEQSSTLPTPDGFVASVRSDASAFPSTRVTKVFKPAYEVINELSQPTQTGEETPYRFHVNRENRFTWFYPQDSARHVIEEGAQTPLTVVYTHPITKTERTVVDPNTHRVKSVDLTRAVYDIVNFIIYKAGVDLNDTQILGFKYDTTSGSPTVKDSFRNWEEIARNVKLAEKNVGNLTYVKEDEYTIANTSGTTAWGQSYSSSSDYNEKFVNFCKRIAESRAEGEFRKTGSPRWRGRVEVRGENNFDANDPIIFTSARHGIQKVFMRITEVSHNISKNGWFTSLQLEEEVPKK